MRALEYPGIARRRHPGPAVVAVVRSLWHEPDAGDLDLHQAAPCAEADRIACPSVQLTGRRWRKHDLVRAGRQPAGGQHDRHRLASDRSIRIGADRDLARLRDRAQRVVDADEVIACSEYTQDLRRGTEVAAVHAEKRIKLIG